MNPFETSFQELTQHLSHRFRECSVSPCQDVVACNERIRDALVKAYYPELQQVARTALGARGLDQAAADSVLNDLLSSDFERLLNAYEPQRGSFVAFVKGFLYRDYELRRRHRDTYHKHLVASDDLLENWPDEPETWQYQRNMTELTQAELRSLLKRQIEQSAHLWAVEDAPNDPQRPELYRRMLYDVLALLEAGRYPYRKQGRLRLSASHYTHQFPRGERQLRDCIRSLERHLEALKSYRQGLTP